MKKKLVFCLLFFIFALCTPSLSAWVIASSIGNTIEKVEDPSLIDVAFLDSAPDNKYKSIEKAIETANNSTTTERVQVIVGTNPTIKKNITINSNVTLNIPYADGVENSETATESGSKGFADTKETALKNNVTIAEGVTITNNGIIEIGGILCGGGGDMPVSYTSTSYSKITLSSNSVIENYGDIKCFGYIFDSSTNDSPSVINNYSDSTVYAPFTINDFKGGSVCYAYYSVKDSKYSPPFIDYEIRNIRPKIVYNYGSKFIGYGNIYAGDQHNYTPMNLIGNTDSYFLQMTEQNYSQIICNYDENTRINQIDFYGGLTTNSLELSINIKLTTIKINMSNYFFPLNNHFRFTLNKNINQDSASITINGKMKLLTGSSLIVNEGVTLTSNDSFIVYSQFNDRPSTPQDKLVPDGEKYYNDPNPGEFIVRGTFKGSDFGGLIVKSDNALVNISTDIVTSYEGWTYTGSSLSTKITQWIVIKEKYSVFTESEVQSKRRIISHIYPVKNMDTNTVSYSLLLNNSAVYEGLDSNVTIFGDESSTLKIVDSSSTIDTITINSSNYTKNTDYTINEDIVCSITAVINDSSDSGGGSCLLPTTFVTLADGSRKQVQYISKNDELLVFNHETGMLDKSKVIFNDSESFKMMKVINLSFSNGSEIGVIYEHGFFDLTTNKYEYIREDNVNSYIGHEFYLENGSKAILTRISINEQYTNCYSPVTEYHLNYFTEGVLSMPGGVTGIFNIFEYDDNLQYDQELMKQDIETYGLLTYEDFAELIPYEVYRMFPAQYFGVAIGKGILTWDMLESYIDRYLPLMS